MDAPARADGQSRAAPHVALAVLSALSLMAVVLSLDTAPANAQQQLQVAASNTVGAGSFELTDTFAVIATNGSRSPGRKETAVIAYRAPDQVREQYKAGGRSLMLLILGSARWERQGGGPWKSLGPGDGPSSAGLAAAQSLLQPFRTLSSASDVVAHGVRYTLEPAQRALLISQLLGVSAALSPAATSFEATVSGEFVTKVALTAVVPGEQVLVRLQLGSFNRVPALTPPA